MAVQPTFCFFCRSIRSSKKSAKGGGEREEARQVRRELLSNQFRGPQFRDDCAASPCRPRRCRCSPRPGSWSVSSPLFAVSHYAAKFIGHIDHPTLPCTPRRREDLPRPEPWSTLSPRGSTSAPIPPRIPPQHRAHFSALAWRPRERGAIPRQGSWCASCPRGSTLALFPSQSLPQIRAEYPAALPCRPRGRGGIPRRGSWSAASPRAGRARPASAAPRRGRS